MEYALHYAALALTFLAGPLLPVRDRVRWPWPELLETEGLQTAHALLCTLLAFLMYAWRFILYQTRMSELVTAVIADPNQHLDGDVPVAHLGLVSYFAFPFTLPGALVTVFLFDSAVRVIAGATHGYVPGTLFLAAPLALARFARNHVERVRLAARFGSASEPDHVSAEGDRLRVRRTRYHPEWSTQVAYRYGDRFYRLERQGETAGATGRPCIAYDFGPWPEDVILRRVLTIEGIPEGPGPEPAGPH